MFVAILLTMLAFVGIYLFFFGGLMFGGYVWAHDATGWWGLPIGFAIMIGGPVLEAYLVYVTILHWIAVYYGAR